MLIYKYVNNNSTNCNIIIDLTVGLLYVCSHLSCALVKNKNKDYMCRDATKGDVLQQTITWGNAILLKKA